MAWVNNQTISCISFQVGNACWIASTWMSCIFEEVLRYAGPKQIHNAAKMGMYFTSGFSVVQNNFLFFSMWPCFTMVSPLHLSTGNFQHLVHLSTILWFCSHDLQCHNIARHTGSILADILHMINNVFVSSRLSTSSWVTKSSILYYKQYVNTFDYMYVYLLLNEHFIILLQVQNLYKILNDDSFDEFR